MEQVTCSYFQGIEGKVSRANCPKDVVYMVRVDFAGETAFVFK